MAGNGTDLIFPAGNINNSETRGGELSAAPEIIPDELAGLRGDALLTRALSLAEDGSVAQPAAYVDWYGGARRQDLTTPARFFAGLHSEFNFTLDGAASAENALLPKYSSAIRPVRWAGERVFCNPPWSTIPPFVELAPAAQLAVLLVPARTNAKWFHRALALGAQPRFFCGKLRFGTTKWNSPVDCLLLVTGR